MTTDTTPREPLSELEALRKQNEALKAAYEILNDDYLSAGGAIAIIVSWLCDYNESMDWKAQEIYDMIAKEFGYPARVIRTELVGTGNTEALKQTVPL